MPSILVTDSETNLKSVEYKPGATLMEVLRDEGYEEIAAICGGGCSCATCHLFVDSSPVELPQIEEDEEVLLELADENVLPKRYLEIALVVVSKINECKYCVAHHTPRLVEQGLPAESVMAILEPTVPGFDEVDMLVRDYAVQVTNNFNMMRDKIFEDLKQHFTEEQIVELTLRTALCGFFNRFNDALQIGMEEGVVADMLAHGVSE